MKKSIILGLFILSGWNVLAQKFDLGGSLDLPINHTAKSLAWIDMDSDSLLDVAVITTDVSGNGFVTLVKNNNPTGFTIQQTFPTGLKQPALYAYDVNLDNKIDLIITGISGTGPTLAIYLSNGPFTFAAPVMPAPLQDITASMLRFGDLDRNGTPDLVIAGAKAGEDFLWLYENSISQWAAKDTIAMTTAGLAVFDFGNDSDNDILISGHTTDSVFTAVLSHTTAFNFTWQRVALHLEGNLTIGDLNQDGNFDAVLAGKRNGNAAIVTLSNSGTKITEEETLVTLSSATAFIADLNSDGLADINLLGGIAGDTINLVRTGANLYDTLAHHRLIAQQFGDADRDGDLDVMQLVNSSPASLTWYVNNLGTNHAPKTPVNGISFQLYNSLFVYWERQVDDHTATPSLTYGLTVEGASGIVTSGDFDPNHYKRLMVTHGNTGTNNFMLLDQVKPGSYVFGVQSIDNAFHTARTLCSGACTICGQLEFTSQSVCGKEVVTLSSPQPALWFSLSKGFMGSGTTLDVKTAATDTLFAFTPSAGNACAKLRVFELAVQTVLAKRETSERYACEGSVLTLSVEPGWQSVHWSSHNLGAIPGTTSIAYTVHNPDTVKALLSDGSGCDIERRTVVKISKPVVTVGPGQQILSGQSAQLTAGGGESYTWTPPTGLNQSNIQNPVASPLVTTEYTVTVTDSIGCTATGKILVIVEHTAYVPNLFTPNGDGNNDYLKIYGLSGVKDFTFTIYNREGNQVYQTTNVNEITSGGWDGTRHGKNQAGGVYYWKVKGQLDTGSALLLNGKKSGSIVLIR